MVILLIFIAASIIFSILMTMDYFINIVFSIIGIFVVGFTLAMYYQLINEIEFAEQDKLPFKADSTKYLYYGVEIEHPTLEDIEIGCVK